MTKNGTTIDPSTANQGYVQVKHKPGTKRRKVRIKLNKKSYTYDLNNKGEFETYPLQMGNGKYTIIVFEQVRGTQYKQVSSFSVRAQMSDAKVAFMCPNQYVWYNTQSDVVAKSNELCRGLSSDAEKLDAIKSFVEGKFLYDHFKALTINSVIAYLPDVDLILKTKKGICFDFASLTASLLRAQGIPAQLVIGYADKAYHAWNRVWIGGTWKLVDSTARIANMNIRKYTPQKYY